MKKIIALFVLFLVNALCSQAAVMWTNDSRTLYGDGKAIIYVLNMRTFSAKDVDGNEIIEIEKGETPGNFITAIKKLDALKNNGINMIHLMPITPVGKLKALGTAGSLYAMDDFSSINPQLDDKSNSMSVYDEAKKFIEECHKRNIRVIVDLPSCGSYDMFLRNPELFASDKDGKPVTPSDWTDVRLFKTLEKDNSVNDELFALHKSFIDMIQGLGADGVRADVATIKPYEFWQMLIAYARKRDNQFLFLAEASPAWTEPPAKEAPFTTYDKLVSAGFDGYLGNFMNYSKFLTTQDLFAAYNEAKKLSERCGAAKNIVLNFATHDDISPMLVNPSFAEQILWLSATLPGNSYFVNGFLTGDYYIYSYANKKADKTYTDDQYYYTHKGKLDIFNFSRQPGSDNENLSQQFMLASQVKARFAPILNKTPNILKTNNKDIFAYEYEYTGGRLIVVLNHNLTKTAEGSVTLRGIKSFSELIPLKMDTLSSSYQKGKLFVKLQPSDILVFMSNEDKSSGKK